MRLRKNRSNHMIIVTPSISKSFGFEIFSVQVKIKGWCFQITLVSIRYEEMIDYRSYTHTLTEVVKLSPEEKSGLSAIPTHDHIDSGAVLYQLSSQANWEPVTL